jgi:hypothetical protein
MITPMQRQSLQLVSRLRHRSRAERATGCQ